MLLSTRDYLASRPMPTVTFEKSLFVANELERLAADRPMEKVESRYGKVSTWIGVLEGAQCRRPSQKIIHSFHILVCHMRFTQDVSVEAAIRASGRHTGMEGGVAVGSCGG